MLYRFYSDMRNDILYDDSYDETPDEDFSESYAAGADYADAIERHEQKVRKSSPRADGRSRMKRAAAAVNAFASAGSDTDVLGSYTGVPNALKDVAPLEIPANGIDRKIADGKIYMNVNEQKNRHIDTKTASPYEYHSDVKDYAVPVQDADDL